MARQKGIIKLKGTFGDLTYYSMDGKDLVRAKSSLDKKRVKTDPAFANSRKASGTFAKAAAIASQVYKQLPATKRKHGLIGTLTGKANILLHEGVSEEDVKTLLQKTFG